MTKPKAKGVRSFQERFVEAYIANGENARGAYLQLKSHVTENTAGVEGHKLLKNPNVQRLVEERRLQLRAKYALTTDRVMQELARVAYFNPRRMLDKKGKPKSLHEMDEDTAAAITLELDGDCKVLKMRTPAQAAKNSALEKGVKILRLYDKPPPPPPDEEGRQEVIDPVELSRRIIFELRRGHAAKARAQAKSAAPVKKKVSLPG